MSVTATTSNVVSPNIGSSKTKKSKTDVIRGVCGAHLKQKCFVGSEKYRKSDFQLLQGKRQFVLHKMIESDLSNENTFTYSNVLCMTNNQHIADQQFSKFTQFVEDQDDTLRLELRRFYGPMLCHLYLELLRTKDGKFALEFLRKYAHLIAPIDVSDPGTSMRMPEMIKEEDGFIYSSHIIRFISEAMDPDDPDQEYFACLITALSKCNRLEAIDTEPCVVHFRSSKYEIHTTDMVFNELKSYLNERGHVILMNLLQTWVHIHIIDNELPQWTEDFLFLPQDEDLREEVKESKVRTEKTSQKRSAEESIDSIKTEMENNRNMGEKVDIKSSFKGVMGFYLKSMQQSREQILKSQSFFPRFIKVADKAKHLCNHLQNSHTAPPTTKIYIPNLFRRWFQKITSADLDVNECHLVAGFNDSTIKIWQLNESRTMGVNRYRCFMNRICSWDLSNTEEEDEETDSEMDDPVGFDDRREKYASKKSLETSINDYGGIKLRGHSQGVTSAKFSKNYPLLFSTSKDSTVRTWKSCNYSCNSIYRGHRYSVWCVDESPTGAYIATGSKDLTARLWCLERNFPLLTFVGHNQDIECLAFHPNGNYLATGSADLSVRLWCVSSGKLLRVFNECKQATTKLAFSPDGKMLAVGGEESKVRIFDLAAGSQLNELKDHYSTIADLVWHPNNKIFGTVCRDGNLRLWDVKKLAPMHEGSSSSSSSSSSSTINRIMTVNNKCENAVRIIFSKDESVCCIGT